MKVSNKNVYIDIDGVILTRGVVPALHLDKFLKYVLGKYSVFWLTSRCHGDSKYTLSYLSKFFPEETVNLFRQIKPTNFQVDKTEAIDFNKRFFWLDNEIFESEKTALIKYDKYDSWIEVDLIKNPNQLLHLIRNRLFL